LEKFVNVGGETYLSELVTTVSTNSNVKHYVDILDEKMKLRQLIHESGEIISEAFKPDADANKLVDNAEHRIFSIGDSDKESGQLTHAKKALALTFQQIQAMTDGGGISGIRSGIDKLDMCTTGFHPGQLIIIAARPGMGKTAFALKIASHNAIAEEEKRPIALFSLEMPKEQLLQRMMCTEESIDMQKMRSGLLSKGEMARLARASKKISDSRLFIDDSSELTPMQVRAKCRRIVSQEGDLGLIVIDYLQLMKSLEKHQNRQEEVASITRALKGIGKEFKVPVIALAQLSRAVEQSGGSKRPNLSHLRESGAIEQDADAVLFVHRESYYMTDKKSTDYENSIGKGEIIVGKQRSGPLEDIPVSWEGHYTRFGNLCAEHRSNDEQHSFDRVYRGDSDNYRDEFYGGVEH
jgi:replicative DNA helicase